MAGSLILLNKRRKLDVYIERNKYGYIEKLPKETVVTFVYLIRNENP